MADWTNIHAKQEVYSHGGEDYELRFYLYRKTNDDGSHDKKVKLQIWKRNYFLFGFLHSHKKIGYREKECYTKDLPEVIEELRRAGKRISDEHAQEMEAINVALGD